MLEDFLDIHEIERSFRKNIIIEYVVFNSILIYVPISKYLIKLIFGKLQGI